MDSATAYYRQAQGLLMPPGMVWPDRESYERRKEAFERIQQKLYGLAGQGRFRGAIPKCTPDAPVASASIVESPPEAAAHISVWDFRPGLVLRIAQTFKDYDGQEILAGEVLHLIETSYFFYDGGHTLRFQEKTIRLASLVDEHDAIIANEGNTWFESLADSPRTA